MNLKDYTTQQLRNQRDFLERYSDILGQEDKDWLKCVINELAEREKHVKIERIPATDCQDELDARKLQYELAHTENSF